jgi:cellulose synthase/poly-beta-1,6-N-acetylglucosamine synthase-like glycosyltransferase
VGFGVNSNPQKRFSSAYLLFLLPFALAFLSWAYFPAVAQWIIANVFRYHVSEQSASPVWLAFISFFYSWYTFLAIGVVGVWIVAAFLARRKRETGRLEFSPMVSFVVPAFNEEKHIERCIMSLYACAEGYDGNCEVIVVDDGSTDFTFEAAWRAVISCKSSGACRVRWRVIRHMVNLGKIEALKTGVQVALGQVIAVVDGDSDWQFETLAKLVDAMTVDGSRAATGYIHPNANGENGGVLVGLQRLEYSQGLGIDRCGQSLGGRVFVVPGAIGAYDGASLREILTESNIRSVTEDSEITLELQKRGGCVSYVSAACSSTDVPRGLGALWRQRLRWFTGWLHNILGIHGDLFRKVSWLSALLWYSLVFEVVGVFVDLAALVAFPFLFGFAPDALNFALNLVVFVAYGLLIGVVNQAVALRFAYGDNEHLKLLRYTPLYPFLWIINVFARLRSIDAYATGSNGKWH